MDFLISATVPLGQPFQVAGCEVVILDPVMARLTIPVPWPRTHYPSEEEQAPVRRQAKWLQKYLFNQGFTGGMDINLIVMTSHDQNQDPSIY